MVAFIFDLFFSLFWSACVYGRLYEHVDGVAMGSPLGLLVANVFLCSVEGTTRAREQVTIIL